MALLLENRKIDGIAALDLFLPKCGDNEILRADLKRAAAIPSKSILFNIDQKADVISKTQIDALRHRRQGHWFSEYRHLYEAVD